MTKFTFSLLTIAAVGSVVSAEALTADLTDNANATPKVVSAVSRESVAPTQLSARALRIKSKAPKTKSLSRKAHAKYAETQADGVIYSCDFAFLSEGSETAPASIELDDWDNIPEELIGEENYGFGGQGIMQAGGTLYVPFEYLDDPDSSYPYEMEGLFWTPDIYEAMKVTIEVDAKIATGSEVDTDQLWVYASDYSYNFDYDGADITTEWQHLTLNIDATSFVPESDDDSYYFTLFADRGADIVIKNIVIKGEQPALHVPVAEEYTDFSGTSFTANWSEVENATGYYLSVYNFDIDTKSPSDAVFEDQFTEDNHYTVTGLTSGNFYCYNVKATNGTFTTVASNTVIVCELASPTGLTLTPAADNKSFKASWEASAGANYYIVIASSEHNVNAGETFVLADADFSSIQSSGTVAKPEESEYWYESLPQLPGWQFTLGCSAPGAFGFWDNAYYTSETGLHASLGSMDYDLSNIKDGTVNVTIDAASPGNGFLAGLLTLNETENKYEVASAYRTPADVPEDFESYSFSLTGAAANTQFLFMTRTENNTDGALLIRSLKMTAEVDKDGTVSMPVGELETAATEGEFEVELRGGVTYKAYVVPYLVDDNGNILAVGKPSDTVSMLADIEGIGAVAADSADTTVRYYNLQGLEITEPSAGASVIKVTGNKAEKIVF